MSTITQTKEGLRFQGEQGSTTIIIPPSTQTEDKYIDVGNITPGGGGVQSIVAGDNITVDDTDPENPIVSTTGGSGGTTYTLSSDFTVNNTTTFAATGVSFSADANSLYQVELYLHSIHEGATFARGKVTLGTSGGASVSAQASGLVAIHAQSTNLQAATLANGTVWPNTYQNGGGDRIRITAAVSVINAGTIELRFAQDSAVAQNTVLKSGSKIVVTKVL